MTLEETIRAAVREEVRAAFAELAPAPKWEGFVTLKKAAELASVSVSTLEKWGRAGLRLTKRGHVRRVDLAELRAFMQQREAEPRVDAKEWAKELLNNVTPMRRAR